MKCDKLNLESLDNTLAFNNLEKDQLKYNHTYYKEFDIKYCERFQPFESVYWGLMRFCLLFLLNSKDKNNLLNFEKCNIDYEFIEWKEIFQKKPLLVSMKDHKLSKLIKEYRLSKTKIIVNEDAQTEEDILKQIYKNRLEQFRGNILETAKSLGLKRTTFNGRLNKYPDLKDYAKKIRM